MILLPHNFTPRGVKEYPRYKEYYKQYHKKRNKLPEIKKRHIELQRKWRQTPEGIISIRRAQKKYYNTHMEQRKEKSIQYRLEHPGKNIEWNKSDNGKISFKKHAAKRKHLGFIPLNEYVDGYEAHHISENFIIFIPAEIHKSIRHNIWTWRGMDAINKLAVEWL